MVIRPLTSPSLTSPRPAAHAPERPVDRVLLSGKRALAACRRGLLRAAVAVSLAAFCATSVAPAVAAPLCTSYRCLDTEQRYEYLRDVVEPEGDWKTAPGEVNLVGVRSFQNGVPTVPEADRYDDTIFAAWVDEKGNEHVESFRATTEAGVVRDPRATGWGYWNEKGVYQGYSHLADGHYPDTWIRGQVRGNPGLRQDAPLRIHADVDNDGHISEAERLGEDLTGDGLPDGREVGTWWSLHFHKGGEGEAVDTWSVACQVIRPEDYPRFVDVLDASTNERYSYTLVDSTDLPPIAESAAPWPARRPRTSPR